MINRICSGLAEAAASGADEALAYDSLKALGREGDWAGLLEKTTRVMSVGFFATMIIGAFSYDATVVNTVLGFINDSWSLAPTTIIRLPIIFTLATSCIVVVTTMRMKDLEQEGATTDPHPHGTANLWRTISRPFGQVIKAASWTFNHRFVLFVILAALALDSVARQFVILASEYYRIIHIPPAWFGFIGAGMALLGFVNARISRYLVTNHSPFFNFLVLSVVLLTSLVGLMLTIPWFGVLFAIGAFAMMGMVNYQSSFYLNREVDSAHRATVLSFRGLALNLGLGVASLLYTGLIATMKAREKAGLDAAHLQEHVFADSLKAFPVYFISLFIVIMILGRLFFKRAGICFEARHQGGD
jgi:hypothetical protein